MIMCAPSTAGRSLALMGVVIVILHPVQAAQTPGDTQTLGAKAVIACAPRLSTSPPDTSLTIIGSQEGTAKNYYGPSDTLVIGGGHAQGADVGQEYFVRRVVSLGQLNAGAPLVLHTAGWIRIVDAERDAAIASVVRACDALQRGDFLEVAEWPTEAPLGPPGAPDYDNPGVILFGLDGRRLIATHQHFVLNLGTMHEIVPGQRLTIFRHTLGGQRAITELGEAVAVTVDTESSTARLIRIRDVVEVGDLVAPQQ